MLTGMDVKRVKNEVVNPIVEKINRDLNSTIGTPGEKPLDYFLKNILMDDGYFYKPKIFSRFGSKSVASSSQQYLFGAFMDILESKKAVYCIKSSSTSGEYNPAALDSESVDGNYKYSTDTYRYTLSGDTKLYGILCDNLDDTVFYFGWFVGRQLKISKFTYNFTTIIAEIVPQDSGSKIVLYEGKLYDIWFNSSTKITTVKVYDHSNLSLMNTYTLPYYISSLQRDAMSDFIYVAGTDYSVNSGGVSGLFKIDTSNFTVVSKILVTDFIDNRYFQPFPVLNDSSNIFSVERKTIDSELQYFLVKRNLDLSFVSELELGSSLEITTGMGTNAIGCGQDDKYLYYMAQYKKYFLLVDKNSMKATKTVPSLEIKGLMVKLGYMYIFNSLSRLENGNIEFFTDGAYERVNE